MSIVVEKFPTLRHACKFICYGTRQSKSMRAAHDYLRKAIKNNTRAYGYKPVQYLNGEVSLIKVSM